MKPIESNSLDDNSSPAMDNDLSVPDANTADLVTAVQYGFYERVVQLIDVDPQLASAPLPDNITLLHWAAINNRIDIAKYLINKGAKIDAIGGALNSTPLQWAVRDGKTEMVVLLLSYNAQPSLTDGEGYACIHLASMFGHVDIVAYLVAKGEDVDLPDQLGVTPLMHAAYRIKSRDPTQLLIRLGASVNHQNPTNKYTALHYAVCGNNTEAISALVHGGAKTSIRNSENDDVYGLAAKSSNGRYLVIFLAQVAFSNNDLPRWLQVDRSIRRFGTKFLPYFLLIVTAFIVEMGISYVYKGLLFFALGVFLYGYIIVFFDDHVQNNLPIATAQASIFCLYACYFYYFLPYVHVLSLPFLGVIILTYFSWSNYYLAIKSDPGYIQTPSRDQQNRIIIQLVEQNLFDPDTFCTWCLTRRPLRSKHCRDCRKCVAKFDHHCPWIDNCVGDKNLRFFTGFVFFTPLGLCLYLHGAYLYFRYHCNMFTAESILHIFTCSPAVTLFTILACLHMMWISGLCITLLFQIGAGFTTNERINFWRYKYFKSSVRSPFSLGIIQNFVDLLNRRILFYIPTNFDWTRIYTLEDFNELIPFRLKRLINSHLSNV